MIKLTYLKFALLIPILIVFNTFAQDSQPLANLLTSVPQEAVFEQMNAMTISYMDYRALERAHQLPVIANRDAFYALDETTRTLWDVSLLRAHAGLTPFVNLTGDRIAQMPELVGFDYFDVDQTLVYGADPFVGNVLRSADGDFSRRQTSQALRARDYDLRVVASGTAWGKGGDGQTDVNNLAMGDPFGGDVGLSSRVAVLDDHTIGNAFIWGIVVEMAETHAGSSPSYAQRPAYQTMIDALAGDDELLIQAVILNDRAGQQQAFELDHLPLPRYELAAIADLQQGEYQLNRVVLLYEKEVNARRAMRRLPDFIYAFDNGWLDMLGFVASEPDMVPTDNGWLVRYTLTAPAAMPTDVLNGAYEPGLIFGFWTNALKQQVFFPLGL